MNRILILGKGGHGKDTAAEIISDLYGLSFRSSSLAACEKAVLPVLGPKYGYKTVDECYEDRRNHREEWKQLITDYNTPDKSRLCREILAECDMYVGMRCADEFAASKELFDEIYYVDASERVEIDDPTMKIEFDPSCMTLIDNNETIHEMVKQIEEIFD